MDAGDAGEEQEARGRCRRERLRADLRSQALLKSVGLGTMNLDGLILQKIRY